MNKQNILIGLFILFTTNVALAQFPGGGRPSGGGGGDGNGRAPRAETPTTFDMDANTPKGNSKITGFVIDSAVTIAVEYANIALINKATNKVVDGGMADGNGKFDLTRVAVGLYNLKVSFIGYTDTIIKDIKIKKGEDIDLGIIKLAISSKVLDEVTVTALKNIIEEKVDRLIYNAENDITSKGGDGADVLRKVPMLSVDLDGNVSLRGSSNIKVLINNKPSTIVASSVADALKMIPADLIKSVEVITSPSAKYDAEGTTGIININTKRSSIQGYSLNVNTGVGVRGTNLGLNGNLRVGKVGFSLGGFGRSFYNKANTTLDQTTLRASDMFKTSQTADAKDNGLFGRYNLGMDIELSKSSYLNGSVSFGTRNFDRDQDMLINSFKNGTLVSQSNRLVNTINNSNNVDLNLDYIKIFKPSHEWSISTQYSQNNLTNNFTADIFTLAKEPINSQQNINGNVNQEVTFQTDYMVPIKKNQLFEVGLKGIFREVNSDYKYIFGNTSTPEANAFLPSGYLDYNQNIKAGYVSYTYSTKSKWSFKTGVRYEHTSIDAIDNDKPLAINSYQNFVPSINVSKVLKSGMAIKMAYNNRIQRPGLNELNPNFNAANPQNIQIGNPNLKPELSNNLEFSLSKSIKKSYVSISVFGRQTNNSILQITAPSDSIPGALITTYQNIGKQQVAGLNFFGNLFLTQKWSLNGGMDTYFNYLEGQILTFDGFKFASNTGIVISGRMMSQLQLNNGWGLQAFGGFRGNQITLQGANSGMGFYSLGLRKDINDKKGSLGIAFDNFVNGMTRINTSNSDLFSQKSVDYIYNQNVKVTFQYKLGNMKFVERKKTKSVNNTDQKSGAGDTQQGGAQQGGTF